MKIGTRTRSGIENEIWLCSDRLSVTAQNITPLERKQVPGIVGQAKDDTARVGV